MSNLRVQGNATGTGTFTIAAPSGNTDRTLTLPDEAGTVLTNVSDIETQVKTATNATGSAPVYSCRAWVNFQGNNTVTIRESGNVSSITDNGSGNYTVNFATAMPDADFSVGGSATTGAAVNLRNLSAYSFAAGSVSVSVTYQDGQLQDAPTATVAVFR